MFGSITGSSSLHSMMAGPATSPYSGYSSNIANQAMQGLLGGGLQNQSLAQQQMHAWNQAVTAKPAKWMFDGKVCDVREMADKIWSEDCPEKTFFILKYE